MVIFFWIIIFHKELFLTKIFLFLYLLDAFCDYFINIALFSDDYKNLFWTYMLYYFFKMPLEIIKVLLNGYYFYIEVLFLTDAILADS